MPYIIFSFLFFFFITFAFSFSCVFYISLFFNHCFAVRQQVHAAIQSHHPHVSDQAQALVNIMTAAPDTVLEDQAMAVDEEAGPAIVAVPTPTSVCLQLSWELDPDRLELLFQQARGMQVCAQGCVAWCVCDDGFAAEQAAIPHLARIMLAKVKILRQVRARRRRRKEE